MVKEKLNLSADGSGTKVQIMSSDSVVVETMFLEDVNSVTFQPISPSALPASSASSAPYTAPHFEKPHKAIDGPTKGNLLV